MLLSAHIKNFGCLPNETFKFASGLNVVIGENGVGKSHFLKLLYSALKVNSDTSEYTKAVLQKAYADKLIGVFRPEALGRLVKRRQGLDKCEVALTMKDGEQSCAFSLGTKSTSAVQVELLPTAGKHQTPAYFPTRELVTLCPWFVPLYDNYHVRFEESWRDTVSLLGAPSLKGAREAKARELLKPLEEAMGGKVVVEPATGEFYLQISGEGKMEMPLVAEGLRKLAMLARLISTGALLDKGYLFWDEPETNLNPKLVKVLARCILHLCNQGIQVFLATHSLFLLRELEMLAKQSEFRNIGQRFFALKSTSDGTAVEQADTTEDINTIVMLDEELQQSDRFVMQET